MPRTIYFATIDGQPVALRNVWNTTEGLTGTATAERFPRILVERKIIRKDFPSNHKCGAKCRSAKGHDCQCECGGKHHGAGNVDKDLSK